MRHATTRARATGCECDGCRLSSMLHTTYRSITKVDAAPFRSVIQMAIAGGVTVSAIAIRTRVSRSVVTSIYYGRRVHIWQQTADKLRTGLLSFIPEDV